MLYPWAHLYTGLAVVLVMTYFLLRDYSILPKKELHSSLWVGSFWLAAASRRFQVNAAADSKSHGYDSWCLALRVQVPK